MHSTDEMLPPDIPHKLRRRPKELKRREEWEGGYRCRSRQAANNRVQIFKDSIVEGGCIAADVGKVVIERTNVRKT